jgi:hypothetical protein
MKTVDKRIPTNLECENGHPLGSRKIWQKEFRGLNNEFLFRTTPHGALDNLWCPECGAPPKDPNA